MIRRSPARLLLAAPWALLALAGCDTGPDPAVSAAAGRPVTGVASGTAPAGGGTAPRLPNAPGQVFAAPAPGAGMRDQAAIAAACRQSADRIIVTRDRGQLMREDERDSRVGSQASIYSQRTETDRLGRRFERDRIAADCVQENTRTPPTR
jgi:hypothetical protein